MLNCLPTGFKQPWHDKRGQIYIISLPCHSHYDDSERKKKFVTDDKILKSKEEQKQTYNNTSFCLVPWEVDWGVFGCGTSPPEKCGTQEFQSCAQSYHCLLSVLAFLNSWVSLVYGYFPQKMVAQTSPASVNSCITYSYVLFSLLFHMSQMCLLPTSVPANTAFLSSRNKQI